MNVRARLLVTLAGLLLLAGMIAPLQAATGPRPDIVGGAEVPIPNPYVWQVSIGHAPHQGSATHYCGGSLIAAEWVLSAAHCFLEEGAVTLPSAVEVIVGLRDLRDPSTAMGVSQVILHPEYDPIATTNDIALLRLSAPVEDPSLIIPLSGAGDDATFAAPGTLATVSGWGGMLGYGASDPPPPDQQFPDVLHAVDLPIVDNAACQVPYPNLLASMICAGLEAGGKDSCQGDSGGPLVVPDGNSGYLLVGVVSTGSGCAAAGFYGIYTRVSSFRSWIEQQVHPNLLPALFLPLLGQ